MSVPIGLLLLCVSMALAAGGLILVQRLVPTSVRRQHNDVAGFIYAVLGVVYAVLLGLMVVAVWEEWSMALHGLWPREAAVVRGMVLGDRSLMPEELEKSFQSSGVTHVLAISGQHAVILAAVIYFALRLFAIPTGVRACVTMGLI